VHPLVDLYHLILPLNAKFQEFGSLQHNKIVGFDTHSVSNQSSAMDSMATLKWVVGPMSTLSNETFS
jgi:hypothetical protein